jgi:hypothetical protein
MKNEKGTGKTLGTVKLQETGRETRDIGTFFFLETGV